MKKITLNNLAALVQGREMTLYQRSLAVQEFDSVVNYLRELEESEKANVSHTGERQSNIPDVSLSVCQHNGDYSKCNIIHMFKCKYCKLSPNRQTES